MEQYLTLTRGNQAPGVIKPEFEGNVNFEIKSQFMRELREYIFVGNKKDDAHEHVERILDIISLFNIPRLTHDAVVLRVFPITLIGASKRWTAKQLEEIHNFKQEDDETLYTAWERNNISNNSNSDGIATIVNKLDNLGRDIKKLKENVHAIQVGCQLCGGPHLDKECPLNKETKSVEKVKYEEFGRPFPNNNRINERFGGGVWDNHDKVIQSLENKVKTLTTKVKGRTNKEKFEECKAIYMEDGTPLYKPFHYSPKEIEYFSTNSGFSDNEKQENETVEIGKEVTRVDITPNIKQAPQVKKQNVIYFVEPYEPPIPFPRCLEQHAKEALGSYKELNTDQEMSKEYESVKEINLEQHLSPTEKRVHWCETISQEKDGVREYWALCDPHNDICDGGSLPNDV
ncbi:hypothetical protein Tco_1143732 [Tanacetum coccineum]